MNEYKFTASRLCDFKIKTSNYGYFDGIIITVRIDGKMPWGLENYYEHNNKKYIIFALSDDSILDGRELPRNLDYHNNFDYSFIIPNHTGGKINPETISSNFEAELRQIEDDDCDLGSIDITLEGFDFFNKTKKKFKEIEL